MTVSHIMTRNPFSVDTKTSVADAQALMKREKIHRLPVLDSKKNLVGIVSEKDLLYASPSPASSLNVFEMSALLNKLTVAEIMSKKVVHVTPDTLIEDAARCLVDNNIGGVPVVKDSVLVGIITESDLFKLFIELFGIRRIGIRLSLIVPEKPGEIAEIASTITQNGGNIISLGTFPGDDPTNNTVIMKVEGIEQDRICSLLEELDVVVKDIRQL